MFESRRQSPLVDRISAIIPTYNRVDLLTSRALTSVLRQTRPVDEIHVVADGMTGAPWAELSRRLFEIDDRRIVLWNIPRQEYPEDPGQRWCVLGHDARNWGLEVAGGSWIAPLDDDDEWTSDHIEVLLGAAGGVDFVYGRSEYRWPDLRPQQAGRWPPGYGAFCDGAQLYRNGLGYRYDPIGCIERCTPGDGDLWNRMVEGGVSFRFVDQVVHHYFPNPR